MPYSVETDILRVANAFYHEIAKLRTRLDRKYGEDTITLIVGVNDGKPRVELKCSIGYGNDVRAATLGALMDEVYRRQGFNDREDGRLQAASDALVALPKPESA